MYTVVSRSGPVAVLAWEGAIAIAVAAEKVVLVLSGLHPFLVSDRVSMYLQL